MPFALIGFFLGIHQLGGDAFVVVDFKTDRAEGDVLDRYRRQVSIYADAIARATGRPTRAVLMKV